MHNESDVEQKLVWALLTGSEHLAVPPDQVRTKQYLVELPIGKGSSAKKYSPDYVVYASGLPVAVIEAKSPHEAVQDGWREARAYAFALNSRFKANTNPVAVAIATNGDDIVFGPWDSEEGTAIKVGDLELGAAKHAEFLKACHWSLLRRSGEAAQRKLSQRLYVRPSVYAGQVATAKDRISFNSFASELAPIIRRYFAAEDAEAYEDILKRGYVSSDQITRYERMFEDHIRARAAPISAPAAKELKPTKTEEPEFTEQIRQHLKNRPASGAMQLLIGGVGSGKSFFLDRYRGYLIPDELKAVTRWVDLNFNDAPNDLTDVESWVAHSFNEQVRAQLSDKNQFDLRSVFSVEIREFNDIWAPVREADEQAYQKELATHLSALKSDERAYARSLARHVSGERGEALIVIFDNVDRRDREQQLKLFQVAQWFRAETRALVVICLRHETYERHKNEPPLDTYLNAVHFYLQSPRFADVAKKRLDLAIEYLRDEVSNTLEYQVPGIGLVKYPATRLGDFLRALYVNLFHDGRTVSLILEGLAGRNVRKSLEMFSRVMQSGHLSEAELTTTFLGEGEFNISEYLAIRVLMRSDYKFFADEHGFVTNLFDFDGADGVGMNFIRAEILYALIRTRKRPGAHGVEGYTYVAELLNELETIGFEKSRALDELNYLLAREMIISEDLSTDPLSEAKAVRIHASGYVHFVILSERVEYVASCALVTQLADDQLARWVGQQWAGAGHKGQISRNQTIEISRRFLEYLTQRYDDAKANPFFDERAIGSRVLLQRLSQGVERQVKTSGRRRPV